MMAICCCWYGPRATQATAPCTLILDRTARSSVNETRAAAICSGPRTFDATDLSALSKYGREIRSHDLHFVAARVSQPVSFLKPHLLRVSSMESLGRSVISRRPTLELSIPERLPTVEGEKVAVAPAGNPVTVNVSAGPAPGENHARSLITPRILGVTF
jgi:hypothetical protein